MSKTNRADALTAAIAAGRYMSTAYRYSWQMASDPSKSHRAFCIELHVGSDGQRCFEGASREAVAALALDYYQTWSKPAPQATCRERLARMDRVGM